MAEAVIVCIAERITEILGSQAIETIGKLWGFQHELKALKDTISILEPLLNHAEEQCPHIPHIRVWVEKLKDAFYEAHDVLEELNIEAVRRELRGRNEMMKDVRTFFSSSNQLAFKLKMSDKVKAVRMKIEAIKDEKKFDLDKHPEKEWRNREDTYSSILEQDIIGRDDDKKRVMEFLQDSNVEENVSILPIVGVGGLGKTALAKYVYGESKFDLKMWVCVSTNFDVKKIVKKMLTCAKGEEPNEDMMQLLQSKLKGKIDGKKYLLVLDDVWEVEQAKWHSLKTLLWGGARGSKILITTRINLSAKITGIGCPYFLKGLSERTSLELLMQMAGKKIEEIQDSDMLAIGEEIVRKCSGFPLIIRTVGSLLFYKNSTLEWSLFKDKELPKVCQSEEEIISVLKLSYYHLPSHLKQCFAFCSLFPKDYEINIPTLVDLWIAEGFIKPSNTGQHLEDISHKYFMDLLWNNFFQDLKKDRYTNEETCKMHDLMHDLACLVAGSECWVAWDDRKPINERTRRISHGLTSNLMDSRLKASALRTYLSTKEMIQTEPASGAHICQLIKRFKRLCILDLHDARIKKVPRSICKLKHLTYLDLSRNGSLKRLPKSITRLQNLQTLNLSGCYKLEELPRGMKELVSLRNLYIDDCWRLSYMPRGLGQLSSLHRLTKFILPKDKALAKKYCGLEELKGLNDIRGSLHIENLGSVTDAVAESEAANLIGKHYLESLTLEWGDFNTDDAIIGDRDEALLNGLRPHSNLQKLTINKYKGERFPRWMMDSLVFALPNLVEVRFSNCKRCRHLPPLGQLPYLKTLEIWELTELEYIESNHLSTSKISFPNLLTLHIGNSKKLKAMPRAPHLESLYMGEADPALINHMLGLNKLKRLHIRSMKFLKYLPEEFLKSLTSLESLKIEDCPRLTSLALGLRHLSKLVDLSLKGCEELDLSKDENGNIIISDLHGGLQSLRSVEFRYIPKLESLPQWLLQARNLKHLIIGHCNNLKALSEQIEALRSLQLLEIDSCPSLTSLPEGMGRLASLTHLTIRKCKELHSSKDESGNINLDFHGDLQSLRSVDFWELPKLESLPQWLLQARNLENLDIEGCSNLRALPERIEALQSLQWLDIRGCDSLTSLPEGMRGLASLTHLGIGPCKELDLSKDERGNILDFHGGLQSLRSVSIGCLPKLESLPPWLLQLSDLECLCIGAGCDNLKALPEQIEALQSLQELEIFNCLPLTSLPEGMRRLTSLTKLTITDCPELEERCKRDVGEDWDKIKHISNIDISSLL